MFRYQSAEEAVSHINSNERVFIHGGAATPLTLITAMTHRHHELRNVEIVQIHTEGEATYAKPEYKNSFHVNSFFIGK
jgi:acyl-CoA hydrolase